MSFVKVREIFEYQNMNEQSVREAAALRARALAGGNVNLESSLAKMYALKYAADAVRTHGGQRYNPAVTRRIYDKMDEVLMIVVTNNWRCINMEQFNIGKELLLKEYRVSYWDRFGVIFPDDRLKEMVAEDREVAM